MKIREQRIKAFWQAENAAEVTELAVVLAVVVAASVVVLASIGLKVFQMYTLTDGSL